MRFANIFAAVAMLVMLLAAVCAEAQQVYWLDTRYVSPSINRSNVNGSGRITLALPVGSLPEGLAIDRASASLYWTEASFSGARVRRSGLGLLFATDLVTGGSAFRGIALASPSGPLLWTSSNMATGPAVRRSNLDGTSQSVVVSLSSLASNPRGIAYQPPPSEFVYVADADGIYRYALNGTGAVFVPIAAGSRPYGVAVDAASNRLYWTEYGAGRIRRSATDGSGVTAVVSGLSNPTYLALDVAGGKIYWIEGAVGAQRIRRVNLDGSGAIENLALPVTSYGGIAVVPGGVLATPGDASVVELSLAAVSPNPAFDEARIGFSLPRAQHVRLSVLDLQGRQAAVLADGEMVAGRHEYNWGARSAGAGVYFAMLRTEGRTLVQRFTVLR